MLDLNLSAVALCYPAIKLYNKIIEVTRGHQKWRYIISN